MQWRHKYDCLSNIPSPYAPTNNLSIQQFSIGTLTISNSMALNSQGRISMSMLVARYQHACQHLVARPSPSKFVNEPCLSGALAVIAKKPNGNFCIKTTTLIPTSFKKATNSSDHKACLRSSSYTPMFSNPADKMDSKNPKPIQEF